SHADQNGGEAITRRNSIEILTLQDGVSSWISQMKCLYFIPSLRRCCLSSQNYLPRCCPQTKTLANSRKSRQTGQTQKVRDRPAPGLRMARRHRSLEKHSRALQ